MEKNAKNLDTAIQNLTEKANLVYLHASLQQDYSSLPRDYGDGLVLTEVEAHTLEYICSRENTTVTQLAKDVFRTKSTISKMLKKLEEKDLIIREHKGNNRKWVYFVPTESGRKANEIHLSYDRLKTLELIEALLKDCTAEEIDSFYKVTAYRIQYLKEQYETCT